MEIKAVVRTDSSPDCEVFLVEMTGKELAHLVGLPQCRNWDKSKELQPKVGKKYKVSDIYQRAEKTLDAWRAFLLNFDELANRAALLRDAIKNKFEGMIEEPENK